MKHNRIGILGARSVVGSHLLSQLAEKNIEIIKFSRKPLSDEKTVWHPLTSSTTSEPIEVWISLLPIWILCDFLSLLQSYGAKRIIALSSTSVFSKLNSANPAEKKIASLLAQSESQFSNWANSNKISWTILRPTLIYGSENDKNISVLIRFIKRLGFFPLLGAAKGLRQPIHAADVAKACKQAIDCETARDKSYNISGSEVLTYQEMISRVFMMLGKKPRFLFIPLLVFRMGMTFLKLFPRFRNWTPAMVERMNYDLIFDHSEATKDFNFTARPFHLDPADFKSGAS